MAKCKFCGRSGWFLSVTESGLCNNCNPLIQMEVSQRLRIINDSMELVRRSKNLDVRVSRCDEVIEHAEALRKFENLKIPTSDPPPSSVLREYKVLKDRLVVDGLNNDVTTAAEKIKLPGGTQTKLTNLGKLLFKAKDYKRKVSNPNLVSTIETTISDMIHTTQLNSYLGDAKKAEFKGQKKKALDKYYELLYFLKHDEIDDSIQAANISSIEDKIRILGGDLNKAKG